jgi:hypothetical protein
MLNLGTGDVTFTFRLATRLRNFKKIGNGQMFKLYIYLLTTSILSQTQQVKLKII